MFNTKNWEIKTTSKGTQKTNMNKQQQRETAIRAARHQLRCLNGEMTIENAEKVLDDLARSEPNLIASIWFINATGYQWRLFKNEWKKEWKNA